MQRRYFEFLKLAFELLRMVIKTFIAREESQPNRKGRLRITRVLCKEGHTTLFIFFTIFELRIPVKIAASKPSQHKARNRCTQLGTSGSGSALGLRLEINCDLSRSANRQQKNMKSVEKATKERFQKASAKPWKARFPSDEPTSFLRSYWVEF